MPSSTELMGDLIQRLDILLRGGNDQGIAGSGLSTAIRAVTGGPTASQGEESVVSSIVGGAIGGGAALLAGLLRSFFGDHSPEPLALPAYEMPSSLFLEYDVAPNEPLSRDAEAAETVQRAIGNSQPSKAASGPASPAVIVQVNALDAQSFAARSDDIASAVRLALARNHSLRDEIWED